MDNIIDMFGIAILEHDGFVDPFDEGTQYRVKKWLLNDMEKYTEKWAVIGFDGGLKVYEENGDKIFDGTLLKQYKTPSRAGETNIRWRR